MELFDEYVAANQKFLDAVTDVFEEGDRVIVCDYHLMLLPSLLRRRFPDMTLAFYLQSPFPSSEFFRILPVRETLLQGLIGADLLLLNHVDYVRHFLNSCTQLLGLESSPSRLESNCGGGRLVSLDVCPLGVDPSLFRGVGLSRVQDAVVGRLNDQYGHLKVVISLQELDVCTGILETLLALDSLLHTHPRWVSRVVLFLVCGVDSASASARQFKLLSHQIDQLVGDINGKYGTPEHCPVRYLKRALSVDECVGLYHLADVAVMNSIKEGINLRAMEFIASQEPDNPGVLVYSEFAG
jgi:trehalose 6-phosphate synthase/phosphatase